MQNLIQSVLIVTAVLMSKSGAEELVYAQVGETVTLKPPVMDNLQKYYVSWFFGEVNVAWSNPLGGKFYSSDELWIKRLSSSHDSLTIRNITQQMFGTFVCKLKLNTLIVSTTQIRLLQLSVTMNPTSPLLPGDSLSLACNPQTPPGKEKPQIHWLNPQGQKNKENKQGQFRATATSEHRGKWTCVVTNNGKEKRAEITVTVVDLSPAPSHPQYTSESLPLTIPCSIPGEISWEQIKARGIKSVHWHFFPKPGPTSITHEPRRLFSLSLEEPMTWKADQAQGLTPVSDPRKKNLSLTRKQGKEADRGEYVCTLEFKNGVTLKRTVHMEVLQIISSPGTDLISGQQLNLTCSLGHPLPSDLQLKWVPPEQSARPSLTPDHLTIPEVGIGDGGKWRCELRQNGTVLTSAVITLKIEPKLSVWMLVIICSVTVIVILVLVLVFILCRRRQRKMRHLRHRLCQCKNPKPKGFYRT